MVPIDSAAGPVISSLVATTHAMVAIGCASGDGSLGDEATELGDEGTELGDGGTELAGGATERRNVVR